MMRTTLFVGLCCALSAPAAADFPHTTLTLGKFCKSTSSLVSCSSRRNVQRADSLTGYKPVTGLEFAVAESGDRDGFIELAEAEKQKDLQTLLQDYINELLGYKKPEKKPETEAEKKPENGAEKAAEEKADAPAAGDASNNATIALSVTSLEDYFKTREGWGTGEGHDVKAPLASGAVSPLPKLEAIPFPETNAVEPIKQEERALPELTAVPKDEIDNALSGLFSERESWTSGSAAPSEAPSETPAAAAGASDNPTLEGTGNLKKYFEIRDSWKQSSAPEAETSATKAASAQDAAPSGESIGNALSDLFKTRESWGSEPAKSYRSGALKIETPMTILGTASLTDFLAQRDSWGTGPAATAIAAPLAAGAPERFVQAQAPAVAPGPAADTIVNEYEDPPLPKPSLVSQADIVRARNALLDERAAWGTEPTVAQSTVTGNLASYIERRERWGQGPEPKAVAAPLAAGASRKLALAAAVASQGSDAAPIINDAGALPMPAVSAVSNDSIQTALTELLATREGWGSEPKLSSARFAGDLDRYIARREAWGNGPKAKPVKAPLAAGASRKLKLAKAAPKAGGKPTIINETEERPLPQLTPVSASAITASLSDLLAAREGWGSAPVISEARVAGDLNAFMARRDRWGAGPKAKPIRAPLAKGASRKLKLVKAAPVADQKPVIINETPATPLPAPTAVDSATITTAMKELLATRGNWGTEPSLSGTRFAGDLNRYFARRDAWGTGPRARRIRAPLAKGASRRLKLAKTRVAPKGKPPIVHEAEARPLPQVASVAPTKLSDALKSLLETRTSWGTEPTLAGTSSIVTGSTGTITTLSDYLAMRDKWQNADAGTPVKVAAVGQATPSNTAGLNSCKDDLSKLSGNRSILFGNNSAELDPSSNAILDKVVETINACGETALIIEGHTDSVGSGDLNMKLSQARAQSVLEYLANAGVSRTRLEAVGFGESKPIASNATRKSRALNRRIEFAIK